MEDVEENEELFSIAQSDVLTVQKSSFQKVKPHLLERLDSWNSLIIVMLYENGLGKKSTWSNHFQILLTDFDTLIFWSSSELAELKGCAVLNKIGKRDADEYLKKNYGHSCNNSRSSLVDTPENLVVQTLPLFCSSLLTEWLH